MTDDQKPDIEPEPQRIDIMIGGVTMEEYFAQKNPKVRRGELADAFVMFIDKATFAEAMDVLNTNLLAAIQGAVTVEMQKFMLGEEESPGGIITKL